MALQSNIQIGFPEIKFNDNIFVTLICSIPTKGNTKVEKPIYVLGTGLSHDGSACLLKNGEICVAIEKERVTRIKRDGGNDTAAIQYCLEAEKISLEDLSLVVQIPQYGFFKYGNNYYGGERLFHDKISVPIVTISHHLAHAYNAIGTMPYHSAAILVMDGCGSLMDECIDLENTVIPDNNIAADIRHLYLEKDSFYFYNGSKIKTIYKDFSSLGHSLKKYPMHPPGTMHSIGGLYSAVSSYIFGNTMDVGKLMGLAPYGKPNIYKDKIFELKEGRVFVNYRWMEKFKNPVRSIDMFKENFQYFADIAYWVQKEIEEAILYVINARHPLANSKFLAYTGGIALNAVANARILKETPFENLYLTPAAGDNGLGVGCAYYGWLEVLKKQRVKHNGNTFFGRIYTQSDIQKEIDATLISLTSTDEKKIANELFSILPHCLKDKNNHEDHFYNIQFILNGIGGFGFLKDQKGVKIIPGYVEKAECSLHTDIMTLIKSLMDREYYVNAVYNKKITEISCSKHLFIFDPIKIKEKIPKLIEKYNIKKVNYRISNNIIGETAELLANGKVIAWFQDGSEFGPRALGHRSILADPRVASIKDFINLKIKFREDFRPFAPSILQKDAPEYFHLENESPYMLQVTKAKDICKQQCPGIVHADNSSRVQTVTPEWNEKYYQLLKEFKRLTGIPILLNTSFNKKGMPIVETPMEALNFFYECGLDNLVIGEYLIHK